jgi:hypothetical protein
MYRLELRGENNQRTKNTLAIASELWSLAIAVGRSVLQSLAIANVFSSLNDGTLKMKAICSSEISVPTRTTLRQIPEEGILRVKFHRHVDSYLIVYVNCHA